MSAVPTVTLVVAIGANGVIGRDGGLPWERTGDLAHFKALTMGHVLIMGRSTYESIGRPLPGRTSIVLTRRTDWSADGVTVAHDLDAGLAAAESIDTEIFVIGGGEVYAQALERADVLVITHVEQSPDGDTWFPEVDWASWRETTRASYDGFSIATYVRAGHRSSAS